MVCRVCPGRCAVNMPLRRFMRVLPGEIAHGGTVAAPMIGDLLRELFKGEKGDKADTAIKENEKAPQEDDSDETETIRIRGQDQSN